MNVVSPWVCGQVVCQTFGYALGGSGIVTANLDMDAFDVLLNSRVKSHTKEFSFSQIVVARSVILCLVTRIGI